MGDGRRTGISTDDFIRRGNAGRWDPKDNDTWTASSFYDWQLSCRRLLLTRDELTWIERQTEPDERVDAFINMSCGTQLIPHVTLDIVGVFKALGVSFVAGTGPQFCCGKIFRVHDQPASGERVAQASLSRFQAWGAKTAVHACQSCQIVYDNFTSERTEAAPGLANQHLSWFLEDRLRKLGDSVPWRRKMNSRVVFASCHDVSPVHHESQASVERILSMIPGVEVVGSIAETSRGAPCTTLYPGGPSILSEVSEVEHAQLVRELDEEVCDRRGADTIVMHAHWCQREWQKFSSSRVSVKHFMSIVAEALGCENQNRYEEYWQLRDPERVVELSRPCWTSWGMSEEQARAVANKHFEPHFGGFVNTDCACGGDPARCNTGRRTLAAEQT